MDKISDKIAALPPDGSYFSLEFFPPKTTQGFANLHARLSRMAHSLRPLFVNVTWGAGGSTSSKSLALAELTQRQLGLTTCLHLTCTNMSRKLVDEALDQAKALGVRNILALRGDPPRSEEYKAEESVHPEDDEDDSNKDFTWAVDLVRYIRKQYGDYFCIGVAGYPEGHADQSHPERQTATDDLPYLVEKVQAGADFIMTQLFYDVDAFNNYEKLLRSHKSRVFESIPIIPGLMPVQSYQILRRTTKLSHARLPPKILERFENVKRDDEGVKRVGVEVISEIVEDIRSKTRNSPKCFHFYTLNLEKAVAQILEKCNLIPPSEPPSITIEDSSAIADEESDGFLLVNNDTSSQNQNQQQRTRRISSTTNSQTQNRVVTDNPKSRTTSTSSHEAPSSEAGVPSQNPPPRSNTLAISEGEGSLGREATWDDFPNGRWGDARSPAYGEIDGYGVSLHVSIPAALRLWGRPTSVGDITSIFERHVNGELEAIPWSEESLNAETATIRKELTALITKGWWTVASQPAVNGVPSSDALFGWGPRNGFCFQKAFVEFFLPAKDWERLKGVLGSSGRSEVNGVGRRGSVNEGGVKDEITFFAANAKGDFDSSDPESVNPVTWGAFRGKEIVTPTIIEGMSFRAWSEEAFGIWREWRTVYPPKSQTAKLLKEIEDDYWLVSVIHHGYVEPERLWQILAEA